MSRMVVLGDALGWLQDHEELGPIITSPPDMIETGEEPEEWERWFRAALIACLLAAGDNYPCVFYLTDRRQNGRLISKAGMVLDAAAWEGRRIMWHKIALRLEPGTVDVRRPGYVHMIAVGGKGVTPGFSTPSGAEPDVFPMGPRLYRNGMGLEAARMAVRYASRFGDTVVNPFCGRGSVLAAAEEAGLSCVGIDNDPGMVDAAQGALINKAVWR